MTSRSKLSRGHRAFTPSAATGSAVLFGVAFVALSFFFLSGSAQAAAPGLNQSAPRYALLPANAVRFALASTSVPNALPAVADTTPHGPFTGTEDKCAVCHRLHSGSRDKNLLTSTSPQSNLCFTCHDGTGALTDVKATYSDPLVPQNNVAARLIYRHDTLVTGSHTSARINEFGGVLNRHTECSDCHDSHRASNTDSVIDPDFGISNSGRLAGSSGVSVVNGAAGAAPTYTYLPGGANPITREYQLCFKCHSGFTTLPSNAGYLESRKYFDKAIEFNPANPSYHPVEAKGKNTSAKMSKNLAGTSPYKQYNLTKDSIISCANCHSNYQRFSLTSPPSLNASSPLHASKTAGILRQNYRNRILMSKDEAYSDADFALCYMCHSNKPFTNLANEETDTNFDLHYKHVKKLQGRGTQGGTPDIESPGGGRGNALCAECHFRQHSTTNKIAGQTTNGTRLVSFSPNVQGNRDWISVANSNEGSCNLTCHGRSHSGTWYKYPGGNRN